ncbi:MAG: hypothetical protein ACRD4V_10680 [Candidatus Acidiferrales bacterium]
MLASMPFGSQSANPAWTREVLRQEFHGFKNPLKAMRLPKDRPGVVFLDNQRLIVYETDWTGGLSSRVNPDIRSAYQLYASVIDADSGELLFDKHWGARVNGSSIHVAVGGVLVQTENELRILSNDFAEIRKLTFPDAPDPKDPNHCDRRFVSVSPTGRTVMSNCVNTSNFTTSVNGNMTTLTPHYFSHLEVWDGQTFEHEYAWTESTLYDRTYSISDDMIAKGGSLEQFGSRTWHPLVVATHQQELKQPSFVLSARTFVTNTSLICSCYGELSLVSTTGHILGTQPTPGNIIIGNQHNSYSQISFANKSVDVAQGGQFVAVAFERWEVRSHLFTEASNRHISTQILVCDSQLKQCPLRVDVTPVPSWLDDYDFALSPDGSKLAVLNGRNISLYFVPHN